MSRVEFSRFRRAGIWAFSIEIYIKKFEFKVIFNGDEFFTVITDLRKFVKGLIDKVQISDLIINHGSVRYCFADIYASVTKDEVIRLAERMIQEARLLKAKKTVYYDFQYWDKPVKVIRLYTTKRSLINLVSWDMEYEFMLSPDSSVKKIRDIEDSNNGKILYSLPDGNVILSTEEQQELIDLIRAKYSHSLIFK